MTDFKVVLDSNDPRCMVHPNQRLLPTRLGGGRSMMTCPICNADVLDAMARDTGAITVRVGGPQSSPIEIVGGPANGKTVERPRANTVKIPVVIPGHAGVCMFSYTLRRCRAADGSIVEVLAPAGQEIDFAWLAARKLTN